jgi:hypothetical protein
VTTLWTFRHTTIDLVPGRTVDRYIFVVALVAPLSVGVVFVLLADD